MWALLKAVVNHRWNVFRHVCGRHWATNLMSLFHSMLFFPIFERDVLFFLSLSRLVGLWVITSTCFFYLHQTPPYEAMVRMPSATSVSLSACALACERRLVGFFWRIFGCSTRWWGILLGILFPIFCSTEIQWWLGWFEETGTRDTGWN